MFAQLFQKSIDTSEISRNGHLQTHVPWTKREIDIWLVITDQFPKLVYHGNDLNILFA